MHTILINTLFVVIIIGFIAYIIEKRIRIKKLMSEIQAEPFKYENSVDYEYCSISNSILGKVILIALIGVIVSVPILYLMNNLYYGMMSLIIIILFLALINFSPYYVEIKNGNLYYRHLIDTLNQTITVPISKIEHITYWEETSLKKILSLCINNAFSIDINVLLISNYEQMIDILDNYIKNREKIIVQNHIRYNEGENIKSDNTTNGNFRDKIKVRTSNDCILLIVLFMAIEIATIFSFFMGYHDIVTIAIIIVIPLFMLKLFPYKIVFYGDRIEYKHIIHTRNRTEVIYVKDIGNIDIVEETLSYTSYNNHHRHRTKVRHYRLNIYKKDTDIISFKLLYENMGDVKQMADIINSKNSCK